MIETPRDYKAPKGELPRWIRDWEEPNPYWKVRCDYKTKEEDERAVRDPKAGYSVE